MSADKKRKNCMVKKKEMSANSETSASSAACNVLIYSCHDYFGYSRRRNLKLRENIDEKNARKEVIFVRNYCLKMPTVFLV